MNVEKIREDFPVLRKGFAYMDSACMSLKPVQVIEASNAYYKDFPSCGERSAHRLGKKVTEEYAAARKKIARFIGAKEDELIFTKNTTEGLNLAANAMNLKKEDIVITSDKEHNSNFLPWKKFGHSAVPTKDGRLDLEDLENAMNSKVKVVSMLHTSNIDGMSFPVKEVAKIVHDNDAVFVIDAAQSVPHKEIDVKRAGCDVMAFSGHKMLGPSVGCVYIREEIAEKMGTFMVGGGTVMNVTNGEPAYLKGPERFEAGLQNYAGAIGLRAAVEYLERVGIKNIEKHETRLNGMMTESLSGLNNISVLGGVPDERGGVLSFTVKGLDTLEAAIMMDTYGVLVRGGFHCCHNWFNAHGIKGSIRASLYLYNNEGDVEKFVRAVKTLSSMAK